MSKEETPVVVSTIAPATSAKVASGTIATRRATAAAAAAAAAVEIVDEEAALKQKASPEVKKQVKIPTPIDNAGSSSLLQRIQMRRENKRLLEIQRLKESSREVLGIKYLQDKPTLPDKKRKQPSTLDKGTPILA